MDNCRKTKNGKTSLNSENRFLYLVAKIREMSADLKRQLPSSTTKGIYEFRYYLLEDLARWEKTALDPTLCLHSYKGLYFCTKKANHHGEHSQYGQLNWK